MEEEITLVTVYLDNDLENDLKMLIIPNQYMEHYNDLLNRQGSQDVWCSVRTPYRRYSLD